MKPLAMALISAYWLLTLAPCAQTRPDSLNAEMKKDNLDKEFVYSLLRDIRDNEDVKTKEAKDDLIPKSGHKTIN